MQNYHSADKTPPVAFGDHLPWQRGGKGEAAEARRRHGGFTMNYKVSVVIPVYNKKDSLRDCLDSLRRQSFGFSDLEILLIDDGSADGSGNIAREFENKYENVHYFRQENSGVSAARNNGIRHACGKYIFFLDSDDRLSKDCIKKVSAFFDTVCDEADLVTYRIETIYKGRRLGPHFRYNYLKESGVYDLKEYAYIGQTTINIAVKNRFEDNILFDESQNFLEDQKYCCDILKRTLKMGFCKDGEYLYYRSENTSSGRMAGSCFVFEQSMKFFEDLFGGYEKVPLAFQGLYVYDLYWKHIENMLFPYHYNSEDYENALGRIKALLKKCDSSVIFEHPNMDFYEKFFFLRLKDPAGIRPVITPDGYGLMLGEKSLVNESKIELVITKIRIIGNELELLGFMKSPFLRFFDGSLLFCAAENDGFVTKKVPVYESSYCYYLSGEKTQRFMAFCYKADLSRVRNVRFEAGFNGIWFPAFLSFMPHLPLSFTQSRRKAAWQGYNISADESGLLSFSKIPGYKKDPLWLYYDCAGVEYDNGLLQFIHDVKTEDKIERYYVITDERQEKFLPKNGWHVKFGSTEHKSLLERCTKVLTAYIEEANIFPYDPDGIEKRADRFQFETIYLQHGVFHIIMPQKYSPERIRADKIVVSTAEEKALFMKNGFQEKDLFETGMARFGAFEKDAQKTKKILFAPSWRGYLAGSYKNRRWEIHEDKFLNSNYFNGIKSFLNSERLEELLWKHGWSMDVKLHPIFKEYSSALSLTGTHIHIAGSSVKEEDYSLFITDFSSYAYDFLYLKTDVIHFIPDINEFRCGMNDYKDLDCPEEFWKQAAYTPDEAADKIELFFKGKLPCADRCTFFPFKNPARELYEKLTGS